MQKVGDNAMSINVGDVSGCLVVIGDYRDTITDIEKIIELFTEFILNFDENTSLDPFN